MPTTFPFLQVIAVAFVFMLAGTLWHGPLFGKRWMSLVKLDPTMVTKDQMQKAMIYGFFNEVVMSAGLALLLLAALPADTASALWIALFAWAAFGLTDVANRTIWEQSSPQLIGVSAGYSLVKTLLAVALFTSAPWFAIV